MDPTHPKPRASRQREDANGKPVEPLCRECGVPVTKCIEARAHPYATTLYKSNHGRFQSWQKRMVRWESGHRFVPYWKGKRHSQEARDKVAEANRKRVVSQETRARQSASRLGSKRPQETRDKMRVAHTGRKCSEEAKRKLSIARTGHKRSRESRVKQSVTKMGSKASQETKDKISASLTGREVSQETRHKQSVAAKASGNVENAIQGRRDQLALQRLAALTKLS